MRGSGTARASWTSTRGGAAGKSLLVPRRAPRGPGPGAGRASPRCSARSKAGRRASLPPPGPDPAVPTCCSRARSTVAILPSPRGPVSCVHSPSCPPSSAALLQSPWKKRWPWVPPRGTSAKCPVTMLVGWFGRGGYARCPTCRLGTPVPVPVRARVNTCVHAHTCARLHGLLPAHLGVTLVHVCVRVLYACSCPAACGPAVPCALPRPARPHCSPRSPSDPGRTPLSLAHRALSGRWQQLLGPLGPGPGSV